MVMNTNPRLLVRDIFILFSSYYSMLQTSTHTHTHTPIVYYNEYYKRKLELYEISDEYVYIGLGN